MFNLFELQTFNITGLVRSQVLLFKSSQAQGYENSGPSMDETFVKLRPIQRKTGKIRFLAAYDTGAGASGMKTNKHTIVPYILGWSRTLFSLGINQSQ